MTGCGPAPNVTLICNGGSAYASWTTPPGCAPPFQSDCKAYWACSDGNKTHNQEVTM